MVALVDLYDTDKLIPPGTVTPFASTAVPSGWLWATGQAISRTQYKNLFAVLGTRFGAGDGSTTFNVPDLRAVFAVGGGSQTIAGKTFTETDFSKNPHKTALNGIGTPTATLTTSISMSSVDLNHTHNITDYYAPLPGTLKPIGYDINPAIPDANYNPTVTVGQTTTNATVQHAHSIANYACSHVSTFVSTDNETCPAWVGFYFIVKT